ncbi:MAG: hypothetical protein LBL15_02830, partial [Oscillospiraceae bacterium]|nr:hypothetical protein [Oscillospiraceae bacterium]
MSGYQSFVERGWSTNIRMCIVLLWKIKGAAMRFLWARFMWLQNLENNLENGYEYPKLAYDEPENEEKHM